MKNYEQYKRLMRSFFCIMLLAAQVIMFWYVWRETYSPLMESPYWRKGHWLIAAVYLFLVFIFPRIYGGWQVGYLRVFNIVYSQFLGTLLANVTMYFIITLLTKHFENPGMLILMTICQTVVIVLWAVITNRIYQRAYPPRKVLLVYGDRPAAGLMKKLHTREDRFEIGEMVHISEGVERIEARIVDEEKGYGGVVICDIPSGERNRILKYCYGRGIRTYTTPKISDVLIRSAESQHMFDTPLLMSRNTGLTIEQRAIKRAVDIVISLAACIPAVPIMAIVALCIKLDDGGSVFYKQKRLTKYGRVFEVYKFRTMKEENSIHKSVTENDDRITKVGKYLRKFRVDELPQLLNILKGDMTVVGPRPEMLENVEKYTEELPEFSYRLRMKAGLTGLAQISGKYNTSPKDKLVMDLMYIENYSIWMDIKLIFQTITVFLKASESTEAFGSQELYDFDEDRERKRKAAQEGKDAPKNGEKGKKG